MLPPGDSVGLGGKIFFRLHDLRGHGKAVSILVSLSDQICGGGRRDISLIYVRNSERGGNCYRVKVSQEIIEFTITICASASRACACGGGDGVHLNLGFCTPTATSIM